MEQICINKVQALYDFEGEGTAELSISEGEILTVTRRDVGEGWWEGTNKQGQRGLFPAAYVKILTQQQSFDSNDYWEEEWDDDWESSTPPVPPNNMTSLDPAPQSAIIKSQEDTNVPAITRKNFNRYSMFVKTGGESYILGSIQRPVPDSEKVKIIETENGVMWNPISSPYVCIVASPKKESKLKGLKSFIAYQLTPSFNNIQVSRRYKHFDWLHERLEEKYTTIPIPPLPDKQISGRYEEQFIEHRKNQLQAFVDCVCRHPVLSRSSVWEHFITCTDEKAWKLGKRKAEKDEFVGAINFYAIEAPEKSINQYALEQEILSCTKFVQSMDGAVKILVETASDQTKKHQGPYKREYQKIGLAFNTLAQAMGDLPKAGSGSDELTAGIRKIGVTYDEIGKLFEEQPKMDWEPLGDMLHIYKGILSSIPEILSLHKKAVQTKKECEKLAFEQKLTTNKLEGVTRRTDIVSYALLAELNHFYTERTEEVSKSLKNFLSQQISFFQQITSKLETAMASLDS
nr:sorting nexin lst-4 isoform X1 [Halyomorpha halys]